MKNSIIFTLFLFSLSSYASSRYPLEPFTIVKGSSAYYGVKSFELGDLDNDGVKEIIYLSNQNEFNVVEYQKPIDSSFLASVHSTKWKLKDHEYNNNNNNFYIVFDLYANGVHLFLNGQFSSPITLSLTNGILQGTSGNSSVMIYKITDHMIWGEIKDSRLDTSIRTMPRKFQAIRKSS
jgi:hypothetical protein